MMGKGGRRRRPQGGVCAQGREVGTLPGGGGAGGGALIPTAHAPRGVMRLCRAASDRGAGGHQGLAAWV